MTAELQRLRFTVEEYHRLAESGILTEDDRVELIDGELIVMSPISGRHVSCINFLNQLLVRHVGAGGIVSIQNPVRLDAYDEPEPDVVVLRPRSYGDELPGPGDVLLLMEVSKTSLAYDRGIKVPLYARAGVPEVWIVDLEGEVLERYTHPVRGMYQNTVRIDRKGELESTTVPGLVLRAGDVIE
jgi:Uma2 family endonuclease